jgi:alpha-D-ribose 1-methylphosphonate 5-triphosphate synthase subunit PhnH
MTDMAAAGTVDLARIPTGFADPVHDAQAVFRVVLEALSRPGRVQALPGPVHQPLGHPAALKPALAAALLALLDAQTSLWLSPALAAGGEVQAWLRFHTGTRLADRPEAADFAAACADEVDAGLLRRLPAGSDEAPHTSATLLVEVPSLQASGGPSPCLRLSGPGIEHEHRLSAGGLPHGFWRERIEQQQDFPCGVDLLLCHDTHVAGLPRSTAVSLLPEG